MFENFLNWVNMGGYSGYVWGAYGVALMLLGGIIIASWASGRKVAAELGEIKQIEGGEKF